VPLKHHDAIATYRWRGRIVTKSTYEERQAKQESGEKRRKTAITSTPSDYATLLFFAVFNVATLL
jgi:NADH:ubiquinone oxidoreductase subunit 3 (subunit A)